MYAKAVVKSARENIGRKPVLRKLSARIDKSNYKLDLDGRTLVLKIHDNKEVKLMLLVPAERVEKFKGWSNYEITVKIVEGDDYVAVYFRRTVKPRKSKTVMTVDINFNNVTVAVFKPSGELLRLKRFKTPLRGILTHKILIERIQRRHAKSWRFIRESERLLENTARELGA